jgi:carboxyl-terminal processing protease
MRYQHIGNALVALTTLCLAPLLCASTASETKASDNPAFTIIEKHLAAANGNLPRAKVVDTITETIRQGITEKSRRTDDRATGRVYQSQDTPSGKMETGFDGKRAWRRAPFFRGYLDDNDAVARALRQPRVEMSEFRTNGMKLVKLVDETIDGKTYHVIESEVKTPLAAIPVKYYFNPTTFLMERMEQGAATKTITEFSDFRQQDGRTLSFARKVTSPQASFQARIVSITHDKPVEAGLFEFEPSTENRTADAASANSAASVVSANNASPTPAVTSTSTRPSREQRAPDYAISTADAQASFELVWSTINQSYWDKSFHGKDWQAIRAKYAPLVASTHTNKSFHELMNRMVGELGRSHMRVVPPHLVLDPSMSIEERRKRGTIGIDMRMVGAELLVTRIDADYQDGKLLKVGDAIDSIDGKTPTELWRDMRAEGDGLRFRDTEGVVRAVRRAFSGQIDQPVVLTVRDGTSDRARTVSVSRRPARVDQALEFESKQLNEKVGYIRFNNFLGDLTDRVINALKTMSGVSTLVVDLRGNGGGVGDLAPALATLLSDQPGSLGESRFRYDTRDFSYAAGKNAFTGKLVILVDGFSASTSEVFAGGLQNNGRATIVGQDTVGAVLPSLVSQLPTGGALQFAISDFRLKDQTLLEGRGVKPDVVVAPTKQDIVAGRDTALQRVLAMVPG